MNTTNLTLSPEMVSKIAEGLRKPNPTALELTVVLKDEERTYRHKFLIYEDVCMNPYDEIIQSCIKQARESFAGQPEDITIKTSMVVQ